MPRNPDAFAPLGDEILDFEGEPRAVLRDFDCLVIPAITLPPAGVRDLERRIGEYWREIARYRLRTADLTGVDLNLVRGQLAYVGYGPYLPSADWPEVARRLAALGDMAGLEELRKLSALLTGDEILPAAAPVCKCVISGGDLLPIACPAHGTPCGNCGGLEGCAPDCGGEGDCGCGPCCALCRAEDGDLGD